MNEGILLVNKSSGSSSFYLIPLLRKLTGIRKIGHTGTLDPFAEGLLVLLVGKTFTKKAPLFLSHDKEYETTLFLGKVSNTYDREGTLQPFSSSIPSLEEVQQGLLSFQGDVLQIPPMFSAKKIQGKKLYELARKGQEVERKPVPINLTTTLLSYQYPLLSLHITCSKGTYIRSLAHDLGILLGCGAHLTYLRRLRCGPFHLKESVDQSQLNPDFPLANHLRSLAP